MTVLSDFERACRKMRRGVVDMLVIRIGDLDRALMSGLADHFDLDHDAIWVVQSIVGAKKACVELQAKGKEQLQLPRSISEQVFDTRYAQHFYGPGIERLHERWEAS